MVKDWDEEERTHIVCYNDTMRCIGTQKGRTRERQEPEDQRKTKTRGPEEDRNQRTRGRQEPEDQRNTGNRGPEKDRNQRPALKWVRMHTTFALLGLFGSSIGHYVVSSILHKSRSQRNQISRCKIKLTEVQESYQIKMILK